jgi:two-component system LytT family sensor kinase
MTMTTATTRRARALRWLVIPVIWVLATVVTSARGGYQILRDGAATPIPWTTLFRVHLMAYAWWALMSPAIVWISRRITLARAPGALRAAAHVASAAIFVAADFLLLAFVNVGTFGLARNWSGVRSIVPEAIAVYSLIAIAAVAASVHDRAMERERELVSTRLQLLRAQLHPHFLFNSLHAISTLIDFRPKDARRMLVGLSELLRETVHFIDESEIPLGREIDWLEQYVELQQLRYEQRLAVDFEIAPAAVAALVPPLVLQPLVENAIKYGIEPRPEGGRIAVSAARAGSLVRLRVFNDGPPLLSGRGEGGVGVRNTRERLLALYGDAFSLELRDVEGGGVEAVISIPFRAAETAGVA